MLTASQLRTGMVVRFEGQTYKVLQADYQPGQGKMGGVMHTRLRNLATGTTWEHGFRAELRVEEVPAEKCYAEFLYRDEHDCYFMDPESFDQIAVPAATIGDQARLLVPGIRITLEMVGGTTVGATLPDVVELRVIDTTPPIHGPQDTTWKPARLENGMETMVPQFVKSGESIRLSTSELKYVDRAKKQAR